MKLKRLFGFMFLAMSLSTYAQDSTATEEEYEEEEPKTFASTRIINGHSVETLSKGLFDMRIEHRFGDIAGSAGGYQNMFGFDVLSDMRIAMEYGITDKLMVGLGRSKGTGAPYRSLLDGFVKYKILEQKKNKMPISMAVAAGSTFTYMKASSDLSQVNSFPKAAHRFAYYTQLNIAKHFGTRLSLAMMPTFVYRNYVAANDLNAIFSLGGAARVKVSDRFALIVEYYQVFNKSGYRDGYRNSLGVALEWFTFGHTFTINLTNSAGLGETQFIPYTTQNWLKGQFRFGFCVGRKFAFQ